MIGITASFRQAKQIIAKNSSHHVTHQQKKPTDLNYDTFNHLCEPSVGQKSSKITFFSHQKHLQLKTRILDACLTEVKLMYLCMGAYSANLGYLYSF